jgi:hypothetical protein
VTFKFLGGLEFKGFVNSVITLTMRSLAANLFQPIAYFSLVVRKALVLQNAIILMLIFPYLKALNFLAGGKSDFVQHQLRIEA